MFLLDKNLNPSNEVNPVFEVEGKLECYTDDYPIQHRSEQGNPLSENVFKLCDRLASVNASRNAMLSMHTTGVFTNPCGTVACVAGFYQIYRFKYFITSNAYDAGSMAIARDLGFSRRDSLRDWAQENPKLWGNSKGLGLFCDSCAYLNDEVERDTKITLSDVINHWRGVGLRLQTSEQMEA